MSGFADFLVGATMGGLSAADASIKQQEKERRAMALEEYRLERQRAYAKMTRADALAEARDPANIQANAEAEGKADLAKKHQDIANSRDPEVRAADQAAWELKLKQTQDLELAQLETRDRHRLETEMKNVDAESAITLKQIGADIELAKKLSPGGNVPDVVRRNIIQKWTKIDTDPNQVPTGQIAKGKNNTQTTYQISDSLLQVKAETTKQNVMRKVFDSITDKTVRDDFKSVLARYGTALGIADNALMINGQMQLIRTKLQEQVDLGPDAQLKTAGRLLEYLDLVDDETSMARSEFVIGVPVITARTQGKDGTIARGWNFVNNPKATLAFLDMENIRAEMDKQRGQYISAGDTATQRQADADTAAAQQQRLDTEAGMGAQEGDPAMLQYTDPDVPAQEGTPPEQATAAQQVVQPPAQTSQQPQGGGMLDTGATSVMPPEAQGQPGGGLLDTAPAAAAPIAPAPQAPAPAQAATPAQVKAKVEMLTEAFSNQMPAMPDMQTAETVLRKMVEVNLVSRGGVIPDEQLEAVIQTIKNSL